MFLSRVPFSPSPPPSRHRWRQELMKKFTPTFPFPLLFLSSKDGLHWATLYCGKKNINLKKTFASCFFVVFNLWDFFYFATLSFPTFSLVVVRFVLITLLLHNQLPFFSAFAAPSPLLYYSAVAAPFQRERERGGAYRV